MNRNNQYNQTNKAKSPADIWREFIQAELKNKSKIGTLIEASVYGGYETKSLTIYFGDEAICKSAKGQAETIKRKLNEQFGLVCDRISFTTGSAPTTVKPITITNDTSISKSKNPLQALYFVQPNLAVEKDEVQRMEILKAAVKAEKVCLPIYAKLKERTIKLAGNEANTFKVTFNWRLRVGGMRGFRELLLPVLHPIFGIPYIPASTLKGAARNWAIKNGASEQVCELLGMLQGKNVKAAKVEFLDAFPTKSCLSIDVATPQWSWTGDVVAYQPVPHPFISLYKPEFLIGLRSTAGKADQEAVSPVRQWLQNALADGIGSRVSGGYGRALNTLTSNTRYSYEFELWTQGMYGNNPPSRDNNYQGDIEFRPTAIRGIVRYWFRAVALSLYDVPTCQELEARLFGQLGKQGKIYINAKVNLPSRSEPYRYTGRIYLEATEEKYLNIAKKLLILASCLGGVGRGSRRPLHLLHGRMRGCHWEISDNNYPLTYDEKQWRDFFDELKKAFQKIQSPINAFTGNLGTPGKRNQDVLDKHAQVWLINSPQIVQLQKVKDWQREGNSAQVQGAALNLLYSDDRFKGERNKDGIKIGNPHVGGSLGTPSYVWIKSIFPDANSGYQVVTIFGCNNEQRRVFAQEMEKLKKNGKAILVFGEMPNNQPIKIEKPRKK
jgi:CRISPR-associated protein Cmr6